MPTIDATGIHQQSAGSSFNGIRSSGGSKGSTLRNPPSAISIELGLANISSGVGERYHIVIGFDTSGITEVPGSATINLAIDNTGNANTTASSHLFKLWQNDSTIASPSVSADGFTAAGAAQNANGNYWNDFVGWHSANSWANQGVEFGSFSLQDAIDAAAAADNKLTITLTAAALQEMVDEDIFIVHISEHTFLGLNATYTNQTAAITFATAAGAFTNDFTPFIEWAPSGDDPGFDSGVVGSPGTGNEGVGSDFVLGAFNPTVLGVQFTQDGDQIPFSVGTPGVRHLRGRTTAYAVEKGETVAAEKDRRERDKKKKE